MDIVTGTHGALYSRSFIEDDFFDIKIEGDLLKNDDLYVSGYLYCKKIPIYVVPFRGIKALPHHKINDLWSINHRSNHNNRLIKRYFKNQ